MFEGEFGRTGCVAEGAFDGIPKDPRPPDFFAAKTIQKNAKIGCIRRTVVFWFNFAHLRKTSRLKKQIAFKIELEPRKGRIAGRRRKRSGSSTF
jgi:hypothetical protein